MVPIMASNLTSADNGLPIIDKHLTSEDQMIPIMDSNLTSADNVLPIIDTHLTSVDQMIPIAPKHYSYTEYTKNKISKSNESDVTI